MASAETRTPGGVTITHVDPMPKASVRAAIDTPAASTLSLPFGAAEQRGDALVARIRPDEWYLLGAGASAMVETLDLSGYASTVDISHSRHAIRVTGAHAADALAKLCSTDFSDPMSPDGAAWSGRIAGVTCDIIRDDDGGTRSYLLLFDGSFAMYFLGALEDAAAEF
ncbi:MAG: sarcosine oxidase subunit gamma family protein [Actinomycetota bacterium]